MIIRAATFEEGSVVIISLVISIFMVPINLIVLTYSSAAFPKMTEYFFQCNLIKFKEFVRSVFSRVFFFGFPIFFFFLFYSNITVGFLLGSEKFA
ncbi:MAG: oligosaccharide flippase family protein [Candidatus Pacebacteria bacterium]|nr:oligosaccharide flippase family protein [Candidatus Paceibacterota bacterium]